MCSAVGGRLYVENTLFSPVGHVVSKFVLGVADRSLSISLEMVVLEQQLHPPHPSTGIGVYP